MATQRKTRRAKNGQNRARNGKNTDADANEDRKATSVMATALNRIPKTEIIATILIALISYFTFPEPLHPIGKPTLLHVWYFGWISALSTGLGVLPLVFTHDLDSYWVGATNSLAAGMMMAASYSLMLEGCTFDEPDDISDISSELRTIVGTILGLLFIIATKCFLDQHEEITVGELAGADARRILMIILVMTLHSFSEGVGIGVSFGGSNGIELGVFISASLAVHNIPEGLAVAIALLPRKLSSVMTALWCVVTSLPQPLMAVPSFIFVHYFIPILPVGLGFAGGAMAWVALFELLKEGIEDTNIFTATALSSMSLGSMLTLQMMMDARD